MKEYVLDIYEFELIQDDLAAVDRDLADVTLMWEEIYKILIIAAGMQATSYTDENDCIERATYFYLTDMYGDQVSYDKTVVSAINSFCQDIIDMREYKFMMRKLRRMMAPFIVDKRDIEAMSISVDLEKGIYTVTV